MSVDNIRKLGSILVVGAHPDDEIFIAAGVMALAVRNGQRVACVTATRGEQGDQDESRWPKAQLPEIRTRELVASLKVLGVTDHTWLSYQDGECANADEHEACENLRTVIRAFRPNTILTFGPDGYTGHPDHQAVSRWVTAVAAGTDVQVLWAVVETDQYEELSKADDAANIFFKIEKPPLAASKDCAIDLKLPQDLCDLKRQAFEAVPSQFTKLLEARPFVRPGEGLARECFVME
jgi:LmbE family N-acetylglucosaminyl deacetylase